MQHEIQKKLEMVQWETSTNNLSRALRIGRFTDRLLDRLVPRSYYTDIPLQYYRFIKKHKRIPRNYSGLFNDILFHLRVGESYYDPLVSFTTCKELSKIYISGKIGMKYVIPTLGVISNPEELANVNFPERCFIKATHTSGKNIFRERGEAIDINEIQKWLVYKHYYKRSSRSSNYKFLKAKIIVEPVIFDGDEVTEYRVFVLNGRPWFIVANDGNKMTGISRRIYDPNWTDMNCSIGAPLCPGPSPKPQMLDEILRLSRDLAQAFSLVRLDFYSNGRELRVGEITHGHGSAMQKFVPQQAEFWLKDILPAS